MKPHERVKEIFGHALLLRSTAERERYLALACQGDAELRQQVESLLAAHEGAGNFLGQTIKVPPPDFVIEPTGTMIGRYRLLEKIGEGGFGVVYMAEQQEPVQRKVALKIIKAGMDTREVIARFEAERQALALMDHPNIAKVLDGGTTAAKRPYFVMELVRGIPITEYCDRNNLSTAERLRLFIKVCQAVQHAHQKAIIHRDLKPSNVMVTLHDGEPVPKVIDFGVAKALGQKLTQKTLFTGFAQMIGTPAYMSPEQAEMSGLDIDTRSDIYSLGVLLYELLTGVTPFDKETLAKAALDEIRRMIRETEPPKPSTRLQSLGDKLTDVAKHRHTEPAALSRLVRGDLDWIVMKCLEKERTRRYETANGLALDVARHIAGQAVLAAPPTMIYRIGKFVRRHRAGVAVVAAFATVLIATAIVSSLLALYARAEKNRAVRAENDALENLYAADIGLAANALEGLQFKRARELLSSHIPRQGEIDRRGPEWRFLWARTRGDWVAAIPTKIDGVISGICVTKDDRFIIAAGARGRVEVIQFEDFRTVFSTNAFASGACSRLDLSADGRTLAVSGDAASGLISIWHVNSDGTLTFQRRIAAESPYAIAISPDGRTLAIGTQSDLWSGDLAQGGITKIFDVQTGRELAALPESGGRAAAFSPDGKWLATGHWHGWGVKLWDSETWKLSRSIRIRTPFTVRFSSDSQQLLIATKFNEVVLHDLSRPGSLRDLKGRGAHILDSAISNNGRWVAYCSWGRVFVHDLSNGNSRALLGDEAEVGSLAISQGSDWVVSGDADGTLLLWPMNGAGNRVILREQWVAGYRSLPDPPCSPDGSRLAVRVTDRIKIMDSRAHRIGPILPTSSFPLAFLGNETLLTISGLDFLEVHNRLKPSWAPTNPVPTLEFWNVSTLTNYRVQLDALAAMDVTAVAASPDKKSLAFGCRQGTAESVVILDSRTGAIGDGPVPLPGRVAGISFSPEQKRLALACLDGKVYVLGLPGLEREVAMACDRSTPEQPAFSADGRMLAVCCWDSLWLFSMPSGRSVAHFAGGGFRAFFSESGRTVVQTGGDITRMWRLPSGRQMAFLSAAVPQLVALPAGEEVAVTHLASPQVPSDTWEILALPPLKSAEEWFRAQPATLIEARAKRHLADILPPLDNQAGGALVTARTDFFARRGEWNEAAAEANKVIEAQPADHAAYHMAGPLLVAGGDLARYRKLCQQILGQFSGTTNPFIADRMAKDCLILPSSGADIEAISQLAETAVTAGSTESALPYFQCTKALAEYRLGHFARAVEWAHKSTDYPGDAARLVEAYMVSAMAQYRLKQTNEARATLARGMAKAGELTKIESGDIGDGWRDWIIAHALMKEAKALIEGQAGEAGHEAEER
jgi:WD40 repeat protein